VFSLNFYQKVNNFPKIISKYYGRITITLLILLAGLKIFLGGCRLWLCLAFVAVVVAYMVFSDFTGKPDNGPE